MKTVLLGLMMIGTLELHAQHEFQRIAFDFYGDSIRVESKGIKCPDFSGELTAENVISFSKAMDAGGFDPVVKALLNYRQQHQPDDWMYYQLIKRTAQTLSPKSENYYRYTLYKWFFLTRTGFDATLNIAGDKLMFYVQCDENIYDIPCHNVNGRQYVCLNYHDYANIDVPKTKFERVIVAVPGATQGFSYKLSRIPDFTPERYEEKNIEFSYQDINYNFRVRLNPDVKNIFANYPVADYQLYFNMPLSSETYGSLIPQLREATSEMSVRQGVDYLMRFTRYAFSYQTDQEHFGKEKRMFAEQTLLYEGSDCEDRAALFFYLVKEMYQLPMIVLAYPEHVTVAVKFDKPIGTPILYNGQKYTICEPTPQKRDVRLGRISKELMNASYEVAYVYDPHQ
jgi:hypothetical protein